MRRTPKNLLCSLAMLVATTLLGPAAADEFPEPIGVFVAGAEDIDGVENAAMKYPQYREQNIVVTNSGKLVVVCQGRNKSRWSDRSGQDLIVKTSSDSGKTWSKGRLVATHGLKSICPNAAVYDRRTNRIHVLYNLFMWDFTNVPKDIRGEMGDLNCRQFVVTSDDEGATWSQPREISHMVQTRGAVMVVGSGEGIQLERGDHKGRLIIAGGDFYQGKKVLCFYSDDQGETWQRSESVPFEGKMAWASESKLAELSDGTLVLNSRTFVVDDSDQRLRTRAFSRDGGLTWTRLENDPALKTVSCNGSLIAVSHPQGKDGTVLLCSVPVGPGRTHGTVYVSFDGGRTWPHSKLVVPTAFAYSSLVMLPDGHIGLFYESVGYAKIELVRFSISWLLDLDESVVEQDAIRFEWSFLPDLPASIGYAGPFVGQHQGALIVAGGANFCNKPLIEGGEKVWHDKIYVLEADSDEWNTEFRLKQPLAYGGVGVHRNRSRCR